MCGTSISEVIVLFMYLTGGVGYCILCVCMYVCIFVSLAGPVADVDSTASESNLFIPDNLQDINQF